MLTESELAAMQDTMEQALPDTCTISRATTSSDGGGGQTTSWDDIDQGVPCRIAPVGGGETGESGSRIDEATTHVVTLAAGRDVVEADQLTINDVAYNVTLVRRRAAWEITRRVEVTEAA